MALGILATMGGRPNDSTATNTVRVDHVMPVYIYFGDTHLQLIDMSGMYALDCYVLELNMHNSQANVDSHPHGEVFM